MEDGLQQLKKMLELTLVVVRAEVCEAWKLWSGKDVTIRILCNDGAGRLKHSSVPKTGLFHTRRIPPFNSEDASSDG